MQPQYQQDWILLAHLVERDHRHGFYLGAAPAKRAKRAKPKRRPSNALWPRAARSNHGRCDCTHLRVKRTRYLSRRRATSLTACAAAKRWINFGSREPKWQLTAKTVVVHPPTGWTWCSQSCGFQASWQNFFQLQLSQPRKPHASRHDTHNPTAYHNTNSANTQTFIIRNFSNYIDVCIKSQSLGIFVFCGDYNTISNIGNICILWWF